MNNEKTNKELLWQLELLVDDSSPSELKQSLELIFREYVCSLSNESIPLRLRETIADYHNLLHFVERLEGVSK
jgi:hypothetical protein